MCVCVHIYVCMNVCMHVCACVCNEEKVDLNLRGSMMHVREFGKGGKGGMMVITLNDLF